MSTVQEPPTPRDAHGVELVPHYADDMVTVHHGDCLDVLRALPDSSIDAVVTDPPYGIGFMGHAWDQPGEHGPVRSNGKPGPHQRRANVDHTTVPTRDGAMEAGRYDLSRTANARFQRWVTAWAVECYRVLKPGGHLLSFGGDRTWHRLTCGIEDAGFEMRPAIAWLHSQGFPKSLDVAAAVDKLDAADLRRARALEFTAWVRSTGLTAAAINALTGTDMGGHYTTEASQPTIATPAMLDVLRPHVGPVPERIEQLVRDRAVESVNYAAREVTGMHVKPAAGQVWRENYGLAADATAKERREQAHTEQARDWQGWGTALKPAFEPIAVGRKPLAGTVGRNVVEYGTGAFNIDATRVGGGPSPSVGRRESAARSGVTPQGGEIMDDRTSPERYVEARAGELLGRWPTNVLLDEGQAAEVDRQSGNRPGRVGMVQPAGGGYGEGWAGDSTNGTPGAPDEGGASRFYPTFRYEAKAPAHERPRVNGVAHPTVKPVDLMRWLVRLAVRPGGLVLDPFAGSGTTAAACVAEGARCITIEREADYLPLIVERVRRPVQTGLDLPGL